MATGIIVSKSARTEAFGVSLTEPVVHPEVWEDVPHSQVPQTEVAADQEQERASDGQTKIREQDELLVLALVKRRAWQEVVDAAIAVLPARAFALSLPLMVVVASHVSD